MPVHNRDFFLELPFLLFFFVNCHLFNTRTLICIYIQMAGCQTFKDGSRGHGFGARHCKGNHPYAGGFCSMR